MQFKISLKKAIIINYLPFTIKNVKDKLKKAYEYIKHQAGQNAYQHYKNQGHIFLINTIGGKEIGKIRTVNKTYKIFKH